MGIMGYDNMRVEFFIFFPPNFFLSQQVKKNNSLIIIEWKQSNNENVTIAA